MLREILYAQGRHHSYFSNKVSILEIIIIITYNNFLSEKLYYLHLLLQIKFLDNRQLRWTCQILEKARGINRICETLSGPLNGDTINVC